MNSDLPPTQASFSRHRQGMGLAAAWSAAVARGDFGEPFGPGPEEDLATAALMTHLVLGQRHGWRCETRRHRGPSRPLGPLAVAWRAWKGLPSFALVLRPSGRWCSSNPAFWDERQPVRLHDGDVLQWWVGLPQAKVKGKGKVSNSAITSSPEGGEQPRPVTVSDEAKRHGDMAQRVVRAILDGTAVAEEAVDLGFRQKHRGDDRRPFTATVAPGKSPRVIQVAIPRDGLGRQRAARVDELIGRSGKGAGIKAVACHGTLALPSVSRWDDGWCAVFGETLTVHLSGLSESGAMQFEQALANILGGSNPAGELP